MCDSPTSKAAKLPCNHIMCHDCLSRIFTLSVTDPQHMPPKCCTQDHIPLKHVDRLFSDKFKHLWNQKYQEFTTKNRIYCPNKGCGEWIKPAYIHTDASGGPGGGRKYGKCSRCKTKVCCLCNGKWHVGKDCPKDEETKKFVEIAKKAGWQRCYNCSAMVELKEGCNHMTW
jgi:IBR domain, a half RING-finger domain